MLKLNLGCGLSKKEGYVNVDQESYLAPDVQHDLAHNTWPWADNSVDEAVASHILEHLTTPELFFFLKELYRVCKHGAPIFIALPWPRHDIYLNDPTHQRPVMPATILMFSKDYVEGMAKKQLMLTPFYKIIGVNFHLDSKIRYGFNPEVDLNDPNLEYRIKHEFNVIQDWSGTMFAVKE